MYGCRGSIKARAGARRRLADADAQAARRTRDAQAGWEVVRELEEAACSGGWSTASPTPSPRDSDATGWGSEASTCVLR